MKVLLISHTCQSRTEGQPKAEILGKIPGLELKTLVPDRWMHYGRPRSAELPRTASFDLEVGKVAWPWSGPGQFYLHWYPKLARLLKEFKPDVIDLWEEPWGLVSAHTCWLRNHCLRSARIVSETEQNIDKHLPFPFEQFRRYTLRNAEFVVGRNAEALQIVRRKGYHGVAEVVPNAVDPALFRPMDKEACRQELGLKGFVVGYLGRLVEEKGLMDLVDALADCPLDAHLLFVGSGPFRSELERVASEKGLSSRIRFEDAKPPHELPHVMNAIDVLALPSWTTQRWKEQFGRVIIEAHACGTPVIGSDSGAIPEVIGKGGVVVPERNPNALAGAIRKLRADPALRNELGTNGRDQVERMYTWERVAERMHSIYKRVTMPTAPVVIPRQTELLGAGKRARSG